jgi:hypothetical protein
MLPGRWISTDQDGNFFRKYRFLFGECDNSGRQFLLYEISLIVVESIATSVPNNTYLMCGLELAIVFVVRAFLLALAVRMRPRAPFGTHSLICITYGIQAVVALLFMIYAVAGQTNTLRKVTNIVLLFSAAWTVAVTVVFFLFAMREKMREWNYFSTLTMVSRRLARRAPPYAPKVASDFTTDEALLEAKRNERREARMQRRADRRAWLAAQGLNPEDIEDMVHDSTTSDSDADNSVTGLLDAASAASASRRGTKRDQLPNANGRDGGDEEMRPLLVSVPGGVDGSKVPPTITASSLAAATAAPAVGARRGTSADTFASTSTVTPASAAASKPPPQRVRNSDFSDDDGDVVEGGAAAARPVVSRDDFSTRSLSATVAGGGAESGAPPPVNDTMTAAAAIAAAAFASPIAPPRTGDEVLDASVASPNAVLLDMGGASPEMPSAAAATPPPARRFNFWELLAQEEALDTPFDTSRL